MAREFVVQAPLPAAAAWIGGSGRSYTDLVIELNQNQWALQGNPCGITCTLANNVRVQMRYDYDATNGFHVDAYKNGEHHVYVMGSPSGAKTGPGNVGIGQYTTSLGFMNNRYRTQDQQGMVATFLSGVI